MTVGVAEPKAKLLLRSKQRRVPVASVEPDRNRQVALK